MNPGNESMTALFSKIRLLNRHSPIFKTFYDTKMNQNLYKTVNAPAIAVNCRSCPGVAPELTQAWPGAYPKDFSRYRRGVSRYGAEAREHTPDYSA